MWPAKKRGTPLPPIPLPEDVCTCPTHCESTSMVYIVASKHLGFHADITVLKPRKVEFRIEGNSLDEVVEKARPYVERLR